MAWMQLTLEPPGSETEVLEAALGDAGALAVTLTDAGNQPLLEPGVGETPLWRDVTMTVLFPADIDTTAVETLVAAHGGRARAWQSLADRVWEREWLQRFAPRRFGRALWVVPGDTQAPDPDGIIVRLDPGLAFGTGDHPTTAMCLTWIGDRDMTGSDVLDYGCGSGILAIAALRGGADAATALDIDDQALAAARDNAIRNGVSDRLVVAAPDDLTRRRYDVVLANILAGPLVDLAPRLVRKLRPGGHLVLSGILYSQADAVRAAYANDIDWRDRRQSEDWVLLAGQRKVID